MQRIKRCQLAADINLIFNRSFVFTIAGKRDFDKMTRGMQDAKGSKSISYGLRRLKHRDQGSQF
jgi:hypothetical protein